MNQRKNKRFLFLYKRISTKVLRRILVVSILTCVELNAYSQGQSSKDTIPYLNLDQCIAYALQHQPGVLLSQINISIAQKTNEINLSGWLPQVYLAGSLTHYNQLATSLQPNPANPDGPPIPVKGGVYNTATPQLDASETILSPGLLYSANSAHLIVQQAQQANDSSKIGVVSTVSKAFYNLLLTFEQINVFKEDTARLTKNLRDAYHQYEGGIVDKTDYEEAAITLNNSKAQLRQATENVRPQYYYLKQIIGFPVEQNFNINFDTAQMMHEVLIDTTQKFQFENRIEYQLLETQKNLQQEITNYYRYQFLPTLSANFSYIYDFESNSFSNLFSQAYPYSYEGLSISIPLFTGFSRLENIQKSKLQTQLLDIDEYNLKAGIYTQYTTALANYKSNLYNLTVLKDNVSMAKDTYGVVSLQYKQGIVTYLNVITAESNLIASEISYINALFQVMQSKVDLQKAMGIIPVKH